MRGGACLRSEAGLGCRWEGWPGQRCGWGGWEANLGWQAWGAGSSGPEMSIHMDPRLGAAAGRGSLLSRGDAPGQTWCKQCNPGTGGELCGGMRWGDWGQIQPPCRQQKRGARLFLGTHLGSRFKWPLPVGPLSYINLDYMMFIDNFGTWVYNDTQFLIQEQDSFPLLVSVIGEQFPISFIQILYIVRCIPSGFF